MRMILALLPSALAAAPSTTLSHTVRMARRGDLPQLSGVVERAFAATTEGSGEVTFMSSGKRTLLETLETRFRIGLDMERRNTPWDWCRHAQVVAEDASTGQILGFAEVWGEDEESLYNMSSLSPQPALFNVCVSSGARRRGVASSLVRKCEEVCRQWGDECMHLKVRGLISPHTSPHLTSPHLAPHSSSSSSLTFTHLTSHLTPPHST